MRVLSLDDVRNQRETILAIAERHGAANVRVFGSLVRGDARAQSDIDFPCGDAPTPQPVVPERATAAICRNSSGATWKS